MLHFFSSNFRGKILGIAESDDQLIALEGGTWITLLKQRRFVNSTKHLAGALTCASPRQRSSVLYAGRIKNRTGDISSIGSLLGGPQCSGPWTAPTWKIWNMQKARNRYDFEEPIAHCSCYVLRKCSRNAPEASAADADALWLHAGA